MTTSLSQAQIERLKREAKRVARTGSMQHSAALDRLAKSNGFENWSLLMRGGEKAHGGFEPPELGFAFNRSVTEMSAALRKLPPSRGGYSQPMPRSDMARELVSDISREFISIKNAVDFAINYMTALLALPRFRLSSASPAYWEMRFWLPYGVHFDTLVNREYMPVGQAGDESVSYADFPHHRLSSPLADAQRHAYSHSDGDSGFLFNDGCPPWASRADALAYLSRLMALKAVAEAL